MKTVISLLVFLSLYIIMPFECRAVEEIGSDSIIMAQENDVDTKSEIEPLEKPLLMTIAFGKCINMGGNENTEWMGRRRGQSNELDWRLSLFLHRHWGVYIDINIYGSSIYDDFQEILEKQIGQTLFYEDKCGSLGISKAIGIGLMYRIEKGRWQFFPRLGCGITDIAYETLFGDNLDWSQPNPEQEYGDRYWEYKYNISPTYLNGGVTLGYRFSSIFSVVLDINYRRKIGNTASMTAREYVMDPETGELSGEIRKIHCKSNAWGNDLTVSLGLQFQCESSAKKMKANKAGL